MTNSNPLIIAGSLSFMASVLHIACIFGVPDWYLFFGAGERMAELAATGDPYPTVVTLVIAMIIFVWGLYAYSGAGLILKLPLLKTGLVLITATYLIRGIAGLVVPFLISDPVIHQNPLTFWLVSSTICCVMGLFYFKGTQK